VKGEEPATGKDRGKPRHVTSGLLPDVKKRLKGRLTQGQGLMLEERLVSLGPGDAEGGVRAVTSCAADQERRGF